MAHAACNKCGGTENPDSFILIPQKGGDVVVHESCLQPIQTAWWLLP